MTPQAIVNARAKALLGLMAVAGVLFCARLFYLQVIRHDYYEQQAVAEHEKKFTIPAKRGTIYARDRDGITPLVLNEPVYLLYADPRYIKNPERAADRIATITGGNAAAYKDLLSDDKKPYVVLEKKINKTQADAIKKVSSSESTKSEMFGIGLKDNQQRVYPEGSLASQLLGFVNDEGDGQYGIEGKLNDRLKGQDGLLKAVTDVGGVPLSIGTDNVMKPAKNGDNLLLTVDRNVQGYAEEALKKGLDKVGATKGSALVMNPTNGDIVAMANYPTYNPTDYAKVEDFHNFQNNTVSDPYEAGSDIKVLTMASGLNTNAINENSTFYNKGYVQVEDTVIKNVEKDVGETTMEQILQNSLNTGVVFILQQLGGGQINKQSRDKLFDYFTKRFGFGEKTGVEQAGEQPGILYTPDDEQGNNVRYANMTFGQGMTTTMVQVAAAFTSVINGGTYYAPHLVDGTVDDTTGQVKEQLPSVVRKNVVSEGTSAAIRQMTSQALSNTLALKMATRDGYIIGGKTGTSQIIDPKTGKYSDENAIGTYVGFGGNETPRYVIMIRVDDSKLGAGDYAGTAAAAPIFADISNWLLDYYKVPPIK